MRLMDRQTPAPPAAPTARSWPRHGSECGGRLGQRFQSMERASEQHGALARQAREYREKLGEYEEVVRTAAPGDDLREVAAAQAGVLVYQRALTLLQPQLNAADEAWEAVRLNYGHEWGRMQKLQQMIERNEPDTDGRLRDREMLWQELELLIGFRPE